jgi:hypothetical protein
VTGSVRRQSPSKRSPIFGPAIGALLLALAVAPRPAAGQESQLPAASQEPPMPDPLAPPDVVRPPVTATVQVRRLDLGMSVFDGYDLTSVSDPRPDRTDDPLLQQDVGFAGVNASLSYSQVGQNRAFAAAAGAGARYYSIAPTLFPVNYYGGLSFSTRVGRRMQLRGSQSASRSPFYSFVNAIGSGDVSQILAPQLDQGVVRLNTITSDSSAGLTWTLNRKASFTTGYSLNFLNTEESAYRVLAQGANGSFQYQKTRYLGIRLGYGYYRSALIQQSAPYFAAHNIDAGIGYRRPLSFSRRSVVGFNLGSTLFTEGTTRNFYVTGDASLSHQLSRRWSATGSFNRDVGRVAAQGAPYVTDTLGAGLAGLVTTKLSVSGSGGWSRGSTASGSQNSYHSLFASGRVGYTLTRFLPIYAEYVYYFYEFSQATGLVPGFPLMVDRHGLRSGLSYALPLIGRRPTRR